MSGRAESEVPEPGVVIRGYGVTDSLQLTLEAQRTIQAAGHVFAISPPPNLLQYLQACRIRVVDLTERMESQPSYAEAYLDAVDVVVRRGATDPPAVLLVPGSPMFFGTLSRFVSETAAK
jgi:hypothetical protein